VHYARNPSLWSDAVIVGRTIVAVLRRTGAVAEPTELMADLDVERRASAAGAGSGS